MPETRSEVEIEFVAPEGQYVATAKIYSASEEEQGDKENSGIDSRPLLVLSDEEAKEATEERIQLLENRSYEYEITDTIDEGIRLRESSVVKRSRIASPRDRGRIEVGGRVGILQLTIEDRSGRKVGMAAVEVRSRKMGYRDDFRRMISDIAERSCDLLMSVRSPSAGRFKPDPGADTESIAQQFAFVRSLLTSEGFRQAIAQVVRNPHVERTSEREKKSVRRGLQPNSKTRTQLARGRPRTPVPNGHPLSKKMESIPEEVWSTKWRETVDTEENRFVKHVLRSFERFLEDMSRRLEDLGGENTGADERLLKEIGELSRKVNEILEDDFFRKLSRPSRLPLGSTVLQQKSGYRKVLKVWLQFGAAARLGWDGGKEVYEGGQRNINKLYQYWIFFHLFDLVCDEFELPSVPAEELFEETEDKFGLKLKAGKELSVEGSCRIGRPLNVEFSYEKSFGGGADYNELGSWTRKMNPDYTLSLWPSEFSKEEAQDLELLTHVHFDAKYRVKKLKEMISNETDDLDSEDNEAEVENYRAETSDLQRAHAYRDAIRQTEGTFILYPGDKTETRRLYREILPGVGALAVNPNDEEKESLGFLLREIAEHTSDMATRREQERYYSQLVHSTASPYQVREKLPEVNMEGDRSLPPVEHDVIVYSQSCDSMDRWIRQRGYVAVPVRDRISEIRLFRAQHVLLWDPESQRPLNAYRRFPPQSIQIRSGYELDRRGYPGPSDSHGNHIVLRVMQMAENWSEEITSWNEEKIGNSEIDLVSLAEVIGTPKE